MISYVIIAFVAILIGMAISVSAFGTGKSFKTSTFLSRMWMALACSIPRQANTPPSWRWRTLYRSILQTLIATMSLTILLPHLPRLLVKAMPFTSRMFLCVSSSRMRVTTTMSSCQSLTSSISMDVPIRIVRHTWLSPRRTRKAVSSLLTARNGVTLWWKFARSKTN